MLELGVLLAQLPELTQFAQSQSPILLLPDVVRRLADPVLAADVGHPGAALRLSQRPQDLLLRMSLLRHLRVLLVLVQRTTLAASAKNRSSGCCGSTRQGPRLRKSAGATGSRARPSTSGKQNTAGSTSQRHAGLSRWRMRTGG